jgi:transposase InsO family protein
MSELAGLPTSRILLMYGISRSTFYGWSGETPVSSGKRKNMLVVLPEEERVVVEFRQRHREIGYRKLTWLMNDAGAAALTESTVYGILKRHDLLGPSSPGGERAADEYRHKPRRPHEHWHTDIAYIKVRGVFYFLIMMLDGYSRYVLGWDLMTDMLGQSVEDFVARVKEKYPHARPKLIHDNGSQFISKDFKALVSRLDIQQVFTRRNHPQTNGKIERLNGTVKNEAIRPACPGSFSDAFRVIGDFVHLYNHRRLHAGINFLRPIDMLAGRNITILNRRTERLRVARTARIASNKMNNSGRTTKISNEETVRI